MDQILATKKNMKQAWTKSGLRIPVTLLSVASCRIVDTKANTADRILVGVGKKKLKNMHKAQKTVLEKAGLSMGFQKLQEIAVTPSEKEQLELGTTIVPSSVFSVGDMVKVTGTTKGHGFTGGVKRYGFKGGPRTHGQADRERAPGSIGSGTTPGRVYKGKHMAGRDGGQQKTTIGLQVIYMNDENGEIALRGIVPGVMNGIVTITKVSEGTFEGVMNTATLGFLEPAAKPSEPEVVTTEIPVEAAPVESAEVKQEESAPAA